MEPIKRRPVPRRAPETDASAMPLIIGETASEFRSKTPPSNGTYRMNQRPMSPDMDSEKTDTGEAMRITRPHVFRVWIWELAALALAVGLMLAKFVILAHFDDQEIPKWPLSINLSTLIALLSMVQRAALLMIVAEIIGQARWLWFTDGEHPLLHLQQFQDAGRSSLGALWLMLVGTCNKARMSVKIIVLLAASVTVLSFGIGPFAQQAINNKSCRRLLSSENATIPISHAAPGGLEFVRLGPGWYDVDAVLRGSMLKGLTGSDDPTNFIHPYCPTGECDFPDFGAIFTYSSIAVCSRCFNSTPAVTSMAKTAIPGNQRTRVPVYVLGDNAAAGQFIGMMDDLHPWLSVRPSNLSYADAFMPDDFSLIACSSFLNISILSFSAAPCADDKCKEDEALYGMPDSDRNDTSVVATSCTLYPCIKNYRGFVRGGTLREQVVSTKPALQDKSLLPDIWQACGSMDLYTNHTAIQEPCVLNDGTWYTAKNLSQVPAHGRKFENVSKAGDSFEVPEDCLYSIEGEYAFAIQRAMVTTLNGTCLTNWKQMRHLYCYDSWWLNPLYERGRPTVDSISGHIEDLATAMTNEFRRNGKSRSRPGKGKSDITFEVLGTQFETTICTTFDWPWLLAPVILTAITALLLAWVLVQNKFRETRQPVWKGSILPLLFYGLNSREEPGLSHTQSDDFRLADLKDINERSKRTRVQFSNGVDGGSLGFHVRDDSIEIGQK